MSEAFKGSIRTDIRDSVPDWGPFGPPKAPDGAPNVVYIVLDDVGSSKPSLWALETVGHVLNTRYNEKRVTLLTTNFLDSDAAGANLSGPSAVSRVAGMRAPAIDDSLTERVGKRIRSRLYEMCRTVEIFGPDYRKEIRTASGSRA